MALLIIPVVLPSGKQVNNQSTIKLVLQYKDPTASSPINNSDSPASADKLEKSANITKPKVKGQAEVLPAATAAEKPSSPGIRQKRDAPNRETINEQSSTAVTTQPENLSPQKATTLTVPAESGAKNKAVVFDPRLKRALDRENNKVRQLQTKDALYTTATGTFVQLDDKCFDLKDLPAGSNSDLNPWFRAKCPTSSRSQADIDRLAEKYGIP
ncbi:hypothetical protein [Microbulbifer sp. THAF38]|uniref:hypothetical protein n=1 Tax=Microbulbifer sp. THAF38 TaxID=2587856 RepID=UPI0012681B49|nr:hypothetical protein [Microbulbifer sp. THAF38]